MANRYLQEFLATFVKKPVKIMGYIDLSSTGVPTIATGALLGVASVTKSGTGQYTLAIKDTYAQIMGADIQVQAAVPVDLTPQILSASGPGKSLVFSLLTGATPTDVAAAARVFVEITMRNSSVTK